MDSAGYVVSHLHKINKKAVQRLAGAMPPQHCVGKGSCLCLSARTCKSNGGSAIMPEAISPDGRQHVFAQLKQLQWPCQLTWSTGKARPCLHGEWVHQASICLQSEMHSCKSSVWLCSVAQTRIWEGGLERRKKIHYEKWMKKVLPQSSSKWASNYRVH